MGRRHGGQRGVLVATIAAAWLYGAMEWLFLVTKPSFMDALGIGARLQIPLIAPLPGAALAALLAGALGRIAATRWGRPGALLAWAVPALLLACTAFLLVDNFTYTVLGFGVASSSGRGRTFYLLLLLALFVGMLVALQRWARRLGERTPRPAVRALGVLALAACAVAAGRWAVATPDLDRGAVARPARRPNILILSTDGLDAARTSAYGYGRRTTPFIATLLPRALVAENALPNATVTAASIVSMLTGKLPLRTGVYSTKDALLGADAYQSLPAILRRTGYATIMLGPGVVDPFSQNLRDAFDVANARTLKAAVIFPVLPDRIALAFAPEVYFLQHTWDRLSARLAHAAGVRPMTNLVREVTTAANVSDVRRVRALLDFVARSTRPVFGLVHLMGTHGPYAFRHPHYSRDPRDPRGPYDDAIREYDRLVARVVRAMARRGKLDETVFVLVADHASVRRAARIPFVVVFPHGAHRGRISQNVQLLDLAPTLLDHLGLPVPAWMEGRSLLRDRPDRRRPILTVDVFRGAPGGERMTMLAATVCERAYELDLFHDAVSPWPITGHTAGCGDRPNPAEARALLVDHLASYGLELEAVRASVRELEMVNANLAGRHLAGARLASRFLNGANLTGATLAGADLVGATLSVANLTDADLSGADMRRGRLHDVNLTRARLARVNLSEARLTNARAQEADLTQATLEGAWLVGADLSGAELSGADLSRANLNRAKLVGARLRGSRLQGTVLIDADLTRADLRDAVLLGANLTGATLTDADLAGADLHRATLTRVVGMPAREGDERRALCPDATPASGDGSRLDSDPERALCAVP
jgi:uncharacterized protein YjbI with pentapeptide repeats